MYGQLKSTVRCLECGNISINFDPFLTLSLPVSSPSKFKAAFVSFELFRGTAAESSEDDDPDYKTPGQGSKMTEHLVFTFDVEASTTVWDLKQQVVERVGKIGEREIFAENLKLGQVKWGEMTGEFEDGDKVD
jgi:hypothetical protein